MTKRWPRLDPPPAGAKLEPPPPSNVVWLKLLSAHTTARMRNGNAWDEGGGLPDPYAVLSVNGKKILQSNAVSDTTDPVWDSGEHGNFEIAKDAKVRIELFDDDGMSADSMGSAELAGLSTDEAKDGVIVVDLGTGTQVRLAVEPAHPLYGMGFTYDYILRKCRITKVFAQGPAARAGLKIDDEVIKINGAAVSDMDSEALRKRFGTVPKIGFGLQVLHPSGTTEFIQFGEGPVYALYSEVGELD